MCSRPSRRGGRRAAAVVVEFALLLPFLMVVVLGMVEIGTLLNAKETLSNAAQRGCRAATRAGMDNSGVLSETNDILNQAGLSNATVTVRVNGVDGDVSAAKRGDQVSVQVTVSSNNVFAVAQMFFTNTTLSSETVVMMRQG